MKPTAITYAGGTLVSETRDALGLFLQRIGRYPLLSAAEEVELAKQMTLNRSRSHAPPTFAGTPRRPGMRPRPMPADRPILRRRPLIAQVIKRQRLIRPLRPTP